jgi:hypothetical protein
MSDQKKIIAFSVEICQSINKKNNVYTRHFTFFIPKQGLVRMFGKVHEIRINNISLFLLENAELECTSQQEKGMQNFPRRFCERIKIKYVKNVPKLIFLCPPSGKNLNLL